jgi:hypothetical protein
MEKWWRALGHAELRLRAFLFPTGTGSRAIRIGTLVVVLAYTAFLCRSYPLWLMRGMTAQFYCLALPFVVYALVAWRPRSLPDYLARWRKSLASVDRRRAIIVVAIALAAVGGRLVLYERFTSPYYFGIEEFMRRDDGAAAARSIRPPQDRAPRWAPETERWVPIMWRFETWIHGLNFPADKSDAVQRFRRPGRILGLVGLVAIVASLLLVGAPLGVVAAVTAIAAVHVPLTMLSSMGDNVSMNAGIASVLVALFLWILHGYTPKPWVAVIAGVTAGILWYGYLPFRLLIVVLTACLAVRAIRGPIRHRARSELLWFLVAITLVHLPTLVSVSHFGLVHYVRTDLLESPLRYTNNAAHVSPDFPWLLRGGFDFFYGTTGSGNSMGGFTATHHPFPLGLLWVATVAGCLVLPGVAAHWRLMAGAIVLSLFVNAAGTVSYQPERLTVVFAMFFPMLGAALRAAGERLRSLAWGGGGVGSLALSLALAIAVGNIVGRSVFALERNLDDEALCREQNNRNPLIYPCVVARELSASGGKVRMVGMQRSCAEANPWLFSSGDGEYPYVTNLPGPGEEKLADYILIVGASWGLHAQQFASLSWFLRHDERFELDRFVGSCARVPRVAVLRRKDRSPAATKAMPDASAAKAPGTEAPGN